MGEASTAADGVLWREPQAICAVDYCHIKASPWTERTGDVRLRVRVQPRSSRSRVVGVRAGSLKIQLHAPPADGAANQELIRLLASWLGVAKGAVTIVQGGGARDKLVEVKTSSPASLIGRLRTSLGGSVDNPPDGV